MTSQRSERGLDWFAFFLADVQTGWGPFVAAYLTAMAWTQFDMLASMDVEYTKLSPGA